MTSDTKDYECKKCGWKGLMKVGVKPRCRACARAAVKEWRRKNPDQVKRHRQRYDQKLRKERPEVKRARERKYYNAIRAKQEWEARIAWANEGDLTKDQARQIYRDSKGKCHYCSAHVKARFTVNDLRGFDHVIARANGGKHTSSNLVVCCVKCNRLKGAKQKWQ